MHLYLAKLLWVRSESAAQTLPSRLTASSVKELARPSSTPAYSPLSVRSRCKFSQNSALQISGCVVSDCTVTSYFVFRFQRPEISLGAIALQAEQAGIVGRARIVKPERVAFVGRGAVGRDASSTSRYISKGWMPAAVGMKCDSHTEAASPAPTHQTDVMG
jgi:hypothetical protein